VEGPVSEHAEDGELEDICPACHGYPSTTDLVSNTIYRKSINTKFAPLRKAT
jgi:hypothetical protein